MGVFDWIKEKVNQADAANQRAKAWNLRRLREKRLKLEQKAKFASYKHKEMEGIRKAQSKLDIERNASIKYKTKQQNERLKLSIEQSKLLRRRQKLAGNYNPLGSMFGPPPRGKQKRPGNMLEGLI